ARTASAECPVGAIDAIIEGIRDATTFDGVWGRIPRESNGASSEAMRVFEMMQPPAAELAVERLLDVLPVMGEFRTASGVRALLRLTFPETAALSFSDRQRSVLRAIASADAAWAPDGERMTV